VQISNTQICEKDSIGEPDASRGAEETGFNGAIDWQIIWIVPTTGEAAGNGSLGSVSGVNNARAWGFFQFRKTSGSFSGIDVGPAQSDDTKTSPSVTTTDSTSIVLSFWGADTTTDWTGCSNFTFSSANKQTITGLDVAGCYAWKAVPSAASGSSTATGGATTDAIAVQIAFK
jgi:hypothetical protein